MDNTDNVRLHRPHEGGGTTRAARNASPGRFSFLRGQLLNFDIAKHSVGAARNQRCGENHDAEHAADDENAERPTTVFVCDDDQSRSTEQQPEHDVVQVANNRIHTILANDQQQRQNSKSEQQPLPAADGRKVERVHTPVGPNHSVSG